MCNRKKSGPERAVSHWGSGIIPPLQIHKNGDKRRGNVSGGARERIS